MGKKKSNKNAAAAKVVKESDAAPPNGVVEAVDSLLLDEATSDTPKETLDETVDTKSVDAELATPEDPAVNGVSNGSSHPEPVDTAPNSTESDLAAKLAEAEARAERAESERDDIQEEYDELCEKLSHVKATVGVRLKKDAEDLEESRKALEKAQQERDAALAQINAHQMLLNQSSQENDSQREDLLTRIAKLEEDLASERQDCRRYKQLAETLEGKIASEASRHSTRETALEHEIAAARLAERHAKQEHDMMKTELETQKETTANLEKEHAGHDEKMKELEGSVREKNLLIGKLRHEAVVLNDHLTNALRLVKKDSEGQTVDKELVSNLFIQFATCPRADTKKFEILMLIADFLGWDEDRRTQVGLARSSTPSERTLGGVFGKFAEFLERESKRK